MAEIEEILKNFSRLEANLEDTYAQMNTVRTLLTDTLSENAALRLENGHLRARLAEVDKGEISDKAAASRRQLYDEGFHICHQFYGRRLEPGENCMLCQELLYR